MRINPHERISVFVRNSLGCTCPPEVFEDIRVIENPPEFLSFGAEYLLELGGRLLVLVVQLQPLKTTLKNLESIFSVGRDIRDTRGFNRFRLVVPTKNVEETSARLDKEFEKLSAKDARLHAHAVHIDCLPKILK